MIICTPLDGTNYELYWSKWYEYIWCVNDLYIDIRPYSSGQIPRDVKRHHLQRIPKAVRKEIPLALPKTHSPWRPSVWKTIGELISEFCRLVKYDSTSDSSMAAATPFQKHLSDMQSNNATDLNVLHLESTSFRSWGDQLSRWYNMKSTMWGDLQDNCWKRLFASFCIVHPEEWLVVRFPLVLGVFSVFLWQVMSSRL